MLVASTLSFLVLLPNPRTLSAKSAAVELSRLCNPSKEGLPSRRSLTPPPADGNAPCLSFIGIVDFSHEAKWLFCTESVSELLGFEPHELMGQPSMNLVHPDEYGSIEALHYETIKQDKAAVIAYLRMRHKDPYKGYILCAVSRTVVHNVLVGSVSFAKPGAKAMHNASTAQEITIITPSATNFEFRRWNDVSPMPPSPIPVLSPSPPASPPTSSAASAASSISSSGSPPRVVMSYRTHPLTVQSIRTALILDRFSVNCPIIYVTNDELLSTTTAMGRSFFDFVAARDEELVRSWIDVIKGWGVNERGQPSDGGFGFGKFTVCLRGRDSSLRPPDNPPARHRHAPATPTHSSGTSRTPHGRPRIQSRAASSPNTAEEMSVDAIFSAHSDGLMVILRRSS